MSLFIHLADQFFQCGYSFRNITGLLLNLLQQFSKRIVLSSAVGLPVLLERIRQQKQQMVKDGKLKAKDIKNDTIIFVGEDNLHYEKFADGSVNLA